MAVKRTPEQEEVVKNRGGALLVSAAAGSGKTRVLVERLMDYILQEGRNIDEFLIITFTRQRRRSFGPGLPRRSPRRWRPSPTMPTSASRRSGSMRPRFPPSMLSVRSFCASGATCWISRGTLPSARMRRPRSS